MSIEHLVDFNSRLNSLLIVPNMQDYIANLRKFVSSMSVAGIDIVSLLRNEQKSGRWNIEMVLNGKSYVGELNVNYPMEFTLEVGGLYFYQSYNHDMKADKTALCRLSKEIDEKLWVAMKEVALLVNENCSFVEE